MSTLISSLTPIQTSTQIRASIECLASRYAAIRVAEGANPEALLSIFDEMTELAPTGDYIRFFNIDRRLHLGIVELANVDGLEEVWQITHQLQEQFHIGTLQTCWPDLHILCESHRPLVDTICSGDPIAAQDAARDHLQAIWYRIAEQLGDASLPSDALSRTTAYIAFHLHEPLSLKFLARHIANVTEGHLARLFRESHKTNITTYIRNLRMHKAANLLKNTNMSIKQISLQVGYQDGSRFAQHFRDCYESTPSQYRVNQKAISLDNTLSIF